MCGTVSFRLSTAAYSAQSSAATCHICRRRLGVHNSALCSFRGVLWVPFTGSLTHTDISAVWTVPCVFTQQVLGSCYHCHEHLLTNVSRRVSGRRQAFESPIAVFWHSTAHRAPPATLQCVCVLVWLWNMNGFNRLVFVIENHCVSLEVGPDYRCV